MWKFIQSILRSAITKIILAFIFGAASFRTAEYIVYEKREPEKEIKLFVITEKELNDKGVIINNLPVISYSLLYGSNAEPGISSFQPDKLDLSKDNKKWLKKFILSLDSCANNENVLVKVYGYASRAEFFGKDMTPEINNKLNYDVAMARASRAVEYIDSIETSNNVTAEFHLWKDYRDMKNNKPINDELDKELVLQEYLNRSIELRLVNSGNCKK